MIQVQRALILAVGLFFYPLTFAAETVVVASDEWVNYTNKDGTGYYFDVLREVFPEPEYKLSIQIVPYARSVKMITGESAHIALGLYEGEVPQSQTSKYVVERDLVDALVTPELDQAWRNPQSLAGKTVVAKIDYGFDDITDIKMNYSEKSSLEGMIKMLEAKRVDAVLDYEEDMQPIIDKVKLPKNFKIKKRVMGADIFFGFSGDAKGKEYIERFNREYKKLWDAGKIHELMKKNVGDAGSLPEKQ
ncbi:MAG: hypothetical protein MI867_00575 [Pseudomonadales bacterium]|nr:hypothetical protein [Pseudomonadales bacterium]